MKRTILLAVFLASLTPAVATSRDLGCPGETTLDMRRCASLALDRSERALRSRLSSQRLESWLRSSQRVCEAAYALYSDGSIYPQLVMGCQEDLNRTLWKQLTPMEGR